MLSHAYTSFAYTLVQHALCNILGVCSFFSGFKGARECFPSWLRSGSQLPQSSCEPSLPSWRPEFFLEKACSAESCRLASKPKGFCFCRLASNPEGLCCCAVQLPSQRIPAVLLELCSMPAKVGTANAGTSAQLLYEMSPWASVLQRAPVVAEPCVGISSYREWMLRAGLQYYPTAVLDTDVSLLPFWREQVQNGMRPEELFLILEMFAPSSLQR